MMSLGNLIASIVSLLTLVLGILLSNLTAVTKASLYDNGLLQAPHVSQLILDMDIAEAMQSDRLINKRVAGFCHHDYETITEQSDPDYFNVFAERFPGDGEMTMRLEMDIFNIYDCQAGELHDSVLQTAQWNIDQLQEAGYAVRIWFTEMPECLGQQLPGFITDAVPELNDFLRPHVMPSKDPDEFQVVVESLVRAFTIDRQSAGKQPVTLFEGWNEVESPGYFFGTRDLLVDNILLPMIKAVDQVESEVGYELLFASHSVANGAEGFTPRVNKEVQQKIFNRGYDVDWINWHWYGTYPFHNYPPGGLDVLYEPVIRNNPYATPKEMYDQVRTMKAKFPGKQLMISEWNAGAGGAEAAYDHKAAAYVAGALIETHHAGLDDGNNFLLKASDGFFNHLDQVNPTGHAMKFFHELGANEIEIEGIRDGHHRHDVSAIAAYDDGAITIMLSRFFGFGVEDDRSTIIKLRLTNADALLGGGDYTVTISRIDERVFTGDETVDTTIVVSLENDALALDIDLPAHTTAFIRVDTADTGGRYAERQLEEVKDLMVYPNPSFGPVTVEHAFEGPVEISIYSLNGKLEMRQTSSDRPLQLDRLPAGEYLLQMRKGDQTSLEKIVFN